MKNVVIIDIDTERVDDKGKPLTVLIAKPEDLGQPTNEEEAKAMINMDVRSLTEGLITLVMTLDLNGYGKKEDYMLGIVSQLTEGLQIGDE
jgi:hypothetical protein